MSDQPTVAVIGCGYWGKNLVRTFAQLGALVAIVDPDAESVSSLAAKYDVSARSLEDVLADGSIDAIAVAAPAKDHAGLALRALEAGKHVYVEKPLALSLADAEAVVHRADELGRVLMVGHLLQYHPAFLELRRMVDGGELGSLRYLYSNRLNLGKFRREENILWSFAPHDLSMILALVGDEPSSVTATGSSFLNRNVPDVTTTHLEFPKGERAHVFVSWLHPFKEQRLVVVGSESMVVFDDVQPWDSKLTVFDHGVRWEDGHPSPIKADGRAVPLAEAEPLRLECEHFLDSVRSGSTPRTDGHEGVRVLRVLEAAQAALSENDEPETPAAAPHGGSELVHQSAYIDAGVTLGPGTRVWHFSHVLSGTTIGEDCTLGQNVVVGPDVVVGDRCRIQNNVSIYSGVTLEDGVFCGPSCVFTNVYNPRAEVSRKSEFRPTLVRRGATIGANATIVCGYEIGEYAFIAAGAVVAGDVEPHALVVGNPARRIGWMSHEGERLGDDLVCPRTGARYEEVEGGLRLATTAGATGAAVNDE